MATKTTSTKSAANNSKKDDFIEIKLPRIKFEDSSLNPLMLFLLILFSFLLGMSVNKINPLDKAGQEKTNNNADLQSAKNIDDVKRWAKEIGLNTSQFNSCLDSKKYQSNIENDAKDAIAAKAEATPTFYINGERIVGAVPYENFKLIIEKKLKENTVGSTFIKKAFAQDISPEVTAEPEVFDVSNGNLPALGDENAPVTMVEFSDFECPFCKRHYEQTHKQIKKDYIDQGKLRLYYRHLPLPIHPMAQTYANASECANEQNKFWEMHDKIFEEQ